MASASPPAAAASAAQPQPLQLLRWQSRSQVFRERIDGLELAMVRIPAGSFVIGSPPGELERGESESQQRLELGEFLLGRTPITQAQWRTVAQWKPAAGEGWQRELDPAPSFFQTGAKGGLKLEDVLGDPSGLKALQAVKQNLGGRFAWLEGETSTDQRPVERVSWFDAMEFCRRLNSRLGTAAGRSYTLPSEVQWEYACRAGTTTPFSFGSTLTTEVANYDGNFTYANGPKGVYRMQTTPVGMFPANAWGLHDMHGNVWEWCLDEWSLNGEEISTDANVGLSLGFSQDESSGDAGTIPSLGQEARILRGCSWRGHPKLCRSAHRVGIRSSTNNAGIGFRVCCLPRGPSPHA
jgi:formylglycine-generating enzyme required for sulfatase activity